MGHLATAFSIYLGCLRLGRDPAGNELDQLAAIAAEATTGINSSRLTRILQPEVELLP